MANLGCISENKTASGPQLSMLHVSWKCRLSGLAKDAASQTVMLMGTEFLISQMKLMWVSWQQVSAAGKLPEPLLQFPCLCHSFFPSPGSPFYDSGSLLPRFSVLSFYLHPVSIAVYLKLCNAPGSTSVNALLRKHIFRLCSWLLKLSCPYLAPQLVLM